jgi:predicted ATPase with chaperone activity
MEDGHIYATVISVMVYFSCHIQLIYASNTIVRVYLKGQRQKNCEIHFPKGTDSKWNCHFSI